MAYANPSVGRARDRERYHKRAAKRLAAGLCPKCGRLPPEPGRSLCGPCAEKQRVAGQARDARLRAAGKPRRDSARAREYERERSRRQAEARREAGMCVRCGTAPAAGGRSSCGPCLAKKREADRIRYHKAKGAGLKYGGKSVATKRSAARVASKQRQKTRRDSVYVPIADAVRPPRAARPASLAASRDGRRIASCMPLGDPPACA